jgi:glycerol-3-phosphate acyltransferase PlsY
MGGDDPRGGGSGNIGATNVLRTLGKKAGVVTLAGDLAKGIVAVLVARAFLPQDSNYLFTVAFAVILGHDFSIFLRFTGGKGVATTIGGLIALDPLIALLVVLVWFTVVAVTRYSSAGSLAAGIMSPVFALLVSHDTGLAIFCILAAALLVYKHRDNIKKLANGTENRVSF